MPTPGGPHGIEEIVGQRAQIVVETDDGRTDRAERIIGVSDDRAYRHGQPSVAGFRIALVAP